MTNEQRYEQHKRDGGKLTFDEFVARKRKPRNRNRKRRQHSAPHLPPDVFMEIYSDLPDGAFWAAAESHGLDPEDFI